MTDQQESLALAAFSFREQMTRSADRIRQRDPVCLEPKRGEFGLEQPSDRLYASEIERAAADVDGLLQEPNLLSLVSPDVIADFLLHLGQRRRAGLRRCTARRPG